MTPADLGEVRGGDLYINIYGTFDVPLATVSRSTLLTLTVSVFQPDPSLGLPPNPILVLLPPNPI